MEEEEKLWSKKKEREKVSKLSSSECEVREGGEKGHASER